MPTEEVPASEFAIPLSNRLIQSKCNAANDTFQQCVRSIHNAVYDPRVQLKKSPEMPFLDAPKLGIFEYRQGVVPKAQKVIYPDSEINDQGKRRLAKEKNDFNLLLDGPDNKRRRKDETFDKNMTNSFVDKRIQTLTRFRTANPRIQSRQVTPSTPIRTLQYDAFNFLATPIVKERTPPVNNEIE